MVRDNKSEKGTYLMENNSKKNLSSRDFYEYEESEITFYLGSKLFFWPISEIRIDYKLDTSTFVKDGSDSEEEAPKQERAKNVKIFEPPKQERNGKGAHKPWDINDAT